jgi:hypothetical protein
VAPHSSGANAERKADKRRLLGVRQLHVLSWHLQLRLDTPMCRRWGMWSRLRSGSPEWTLAGSADWIFTSNNHHMSVIGPEMPNLTASHSSANTYGAFSVDVNGAGRHWSCGGRLRTEGGSTALIGSGGISWRQWPTPERNQQGSPGQIRRLARPGSGRLHSDALHT